MNLTSVAATITSTWTSTTYWSSTSAWGGNWGSSSAWGGTWGSSPATPANGVTYPDGVTITIPDINALAEDVENAANNAVGKSNF